jgi:hypothetical protein
MSKARQNRPLFDILTQNLPNDSVNLMTLRYQQSLSMQLTKSKYFWKKMQSVVDWNRMIEKYNSLIKYK